LLQRTGIARLDGMIREGQKEVHQRLDAPRLGPRRLGIVGHQLVDQIHELLGELERFSVRHTTERVPSERVSDRESE